MRELLDRVLVLSPHRDDEILGMGGTLPQCNSLHIMYFNSVHPLVDQAVYDAEAKAVKRTLGCSVSYSQHTGVNHLAEIPIAHFIDEIERALNVHKPSALYIPFPSYNQDHRVIFEAAITASRPHDRNYFVPNVLVYEQPETLGTNRLEPRFTPHVFIGIDIKVKLSLWELYKSQHRGHRTKKHLKHLAGVRGIQYNVKYAEAFMVIRTGA